MSDEVEASIQVDNKMVLYRTSDIYFASFLCSLDFPMENTEKDKSPDGKGKVVFVFRAPSGDIGRAKTLYFGGTGTVKVRKFVDNIRSLKQLVFT